MPAKGKTSRFTSDQSLEFVRIVKEALSSVGCELVDWWVDFTTAGLEISNIKTTCQDNTLVIDKIRDRMPEVVSGFAGQPNYYAMISVISSIKANAMDAGFDVSAFSKGDDDIILTVTEYTPEPEPEDILEPMPPTHPPAAGALPPAEPELELPPGGGMEPSAGREF